MVLISPWVMLLNIKCNSDMSQHISTFPFKQMSQVGVSNDRLQIPTMPYRNDLHTKKTFIAACNSISKLATTRKWYATHSMPRMHERRTNFYQALSPPWGQKQCLQITQPQQSVEWHSVMSTSNCHVSTVYLSVIPQYVYLPMSAIKYRHDTDLSC